MVRRNSGESVSTEYHESISAGMDFSMACVSTKAVLSLTAAQQGGEKSQPPASPASRPRFRWPSCCSRRPARSSPAPQDWHDVEDRLRLAGSRRALDNADLIPEGCLDGSLLAGVAPEGVDERRRRELPGRVLAGIQVEGCRRTVGDEVDFLVLHHQQFLPVVGFQRIEFRHVAQIGEAILCGRPPPSTTEPVQPPFPCSGLRCRWRIPHTRIAAHLVGRRRCRRAALSGGLCGADGQCCGSNTTGSFSHNTLLGT